MARSFVRASTEYLYTAGAPVTAYPFAMACQFRPVDENAETTLLALGATGGGDYRYHALLAQGYNNYDTVRAQERETGTARKAIATAQYTHDVWGHACALFISQTSRAALFNGANKGVNTDDPGSITTSGHTSIGARAFSSTVTMPYSGRIAEAGIWDLSAWPGATDADKAAEFERVAIPALALGYAPSFFPLGLVAYWRLIRDEDQDLVGGYDLTAYNTPSIATHPPNMKYPAPPRVWHVVSAAPSYALPMAMHHYGMRRAAQCG